MKILLWLGIVLVVLGLGSLLRTFWAVQRFNTQGVGAVAGGGGPVALLLLGVALLSVVMVVRVILR